MVKVIWLMGFVIGIPAFLTSCIKSSKVAAAGDKLKSVMVNSSFYDIEATSLDGKTISMSAYKGKKIVVLNVASKCGYTPQYADWQAFYEQNRDSIVVLGFPCNQFLGQEPGSSAEIADFCTSQYGVTFPMFEKVNVKGADQHPVYKWLTSPAENGWNSDEPSWNFCKYLIDEKGRLTHFFGSKIKPDHPAFVSAIRETK